MAVTNACFIGITIFFIEFAQRSGGTRLNEKLNDIHLRVVVTQVFNVIN